MAWRCSAATNAGLVDNLVTANILSTPRIIAAMKATDRAHYSPRRPYDDCPQSLGFGATISAPHMHAHALESLAPMLKPGASVLDIGSGSGYLVAVFSRLVRPGGKVIGVEHIKELNEAAEKRFVADEGTVAKEILQKGEVVFKTSDGRRGCPGEMFDVIHVGAAVPVVPDALLEQLKAPGKMFIPVGDVHEDQYIYEYTKDAVGNLKRERLFGVSYVPLGDVEYYYARGMKLVE
ncbi:protein-L-isoaspartate O-methyltransferase [Lipomyces tetrasporus]|uniref:protein-L-isoaspartate(D-aspartate) O-methyltransferase n=1 Tax=Lipomyces tetrasporus TaxID=54092 RepID=A0AAD7QRF4_9ASCO|nr:protein-L-isoaspartate O-methyltransferase [Lipomyces tetrasporus]KAJ8099933.1 protein-L-isoaspartate O-methyltransferase [Lipomyces tetrasporus]